MARRGIQRDDLTDPFGGHRLPVVWMDTAGGHQPQMLGNEGQQSPWFVGGKRGNPEPLFDDSFGASNEPDVALRECGPGYIHGTRLLDVGSQTPIPIRIGGGSPLGPTGKAPAMMGQGGDTVVSPTRYQRQPALAHIPPETTVTIGSISRQSYQYVREQMPDKRPRNTGAGWPSNNPPGVPVRQIGQTIPPALEPPRYSGVGLDTDYIQQQQDILLSKAALGGM